MDLQRTAEDQDGTLCVQLSSVTTAGPRRRRRDGAPGVRKRRRGYTSFSREEELQVGVHQHKVGSVSGAALGALGATLHTEMAQEGKSGAARFKPVFQTHFWRDETKGKVVHEEFKRICRTLRINKAKL